MNNVPAFTTDTIRVRTQLSTAKAIANLNTVAFNILVCKADATVWAVVSRDQNGGVALPAIPPVGPLEHDAQEETDDVDRHSVFSPTLAGVAERLGENSERRIDLTEHINDVVGLFDRENITDVILCGHSYGGMVISGVAERISDRIRHLVHIDAVVPENGKRMTDILPGSRIQMVVAAVAILGGGRTLMAPPASFFEVNTADRKMVDQRLTPHPVASLRYP